MVHNDPEQWIKSTRQWMIFRMGPTIAVYCYALFSHAHTKATESPYVVIGLILLAFVMLFRAVKSVVGYRGPARYTIFFYVLECIALVILAYAVLYHTMVAYDSNSFQHMHTLTGLDALYYSVYTFVDYGTLSPITTLAKWVVMSEMAFTFLAGTFVMGILVSIFLRTTE